MVPIFADSEAPGISLEFLEHCQARSLLTIAHNREIPTKKFCRPVKEILTLVSGLLNSVNSRCDSLHDLNKNRGHGCILLSEYFGNALVP